MTYLLSEVASGFTGIEMIGCENDATHHSRNSKNSNMLGLLLCGETVVRLRFALLSGPLNMLLCCVIVCSSLVRGVWCMPLCSDCTAFIHQLSSVAVS